MVSISHNTKEHLPRKKDEWFSLDRLLCTVILRREKCSVAFSNYPRDQTSRGSISVICAGIKEEILLAQPSVPGCYYQRGLS